MSDPPAHELGMNDIRDNYKRTAIFKKSYSFGVGPREPILDGTACVIVNQHSHAETMTYLVDVMYSDSEGKIFIVTSLCSPDDPESFYLGWPK